MIRRQSYASGFMLCSRQMSPNIIERAKYLILDDVGCALVGPMCPGPNNWAMQRASLSLRASAALLATRTTVGPPLLPCSRSIAQALGTDRE